MRPVDFWIIEHASALFIASLVLAGLLGATLGPALRFGLRRVRHRRAMRALGPPLDHTAETRARGATVEGALEGAAASGLVALDGGRDDESSRWRAPGIALQCPIGRVELVGPIAIVGGRSVSNDPRIGDDARGLAVGDTARVAGVLEAIAPGDSEREGYRDASSGWRLVPGAGGLLRAAALEPPRRPSAVERVGSSLIAACLASLTLVAACAIAKSRADTLRGVEENQGARLVCAGGGVAWAVLASVSPLTRRGALDGLVRTLACREVRRIADVEAQARILSINLGAAESCMQRAELFERATRFERAAALYGTCGGEAARDQAARLWAYVAHFERASALARERSARSVDPVALVEQYARWHLLAGDRASAERALRRAQTLALAPSRGSTFATRRRDGGFSRTLDMAQEALDALVGDGAAAAERCDSGRGAGSAPRCSDDRRMERLDQGEVDARVRRESARLGRGPLRDALEARDARAALRALRREPPTLARDLIVAVVASGQRGDEDRERIRAWVETEFPHEPGRGFDAGTVRWLAAAIDHPALLAEAREIARRRCEQERREAREPALCALR